MRYKVGDTVRLKKSRQGDLYFDKYTGNGIITQILSNNVIRIKWDLDDEVWQYDEPWLRLRKRA